MRAGGLESGREEPELGSEGLAVSVGMGGGAKVDCFVERRPARSWSRCPLVVAMERGAYLRTWEDVRLGQEVRWPASMESHQVDREGENRHA